jgi:hypothetical protein
MTPEMIMTAIEAVLSEHPEVKICMKPAALGFRSGANELLVAGHDGTQYRMRVKFIDAAARDEDEE